MKNSTKIVMSALIGFIHASYGHAQLGTFSSVTPAKTPVATRTPVAKPTQAALPDTGTIRIVLSKVHGLGTAEYNASAKPTQARGVRLVALVTGKRFSADSSGAFKVSDQISQLDFVMPSRVVALSMREDICLDGLARLKSNTAPSTAFELTFRGRKTANGRYLASEILGCGDVVSEPARILPATPTPKR